MADFGDSGSLVYTKEGMAIGMVFAKSDTETRVIPIQNILGINTT